MNLDKVASKKRRLKQRHAEEYRCLCCFNSEWLCGWYTPRPLHVKLIVMYNIMQCFLWFIYYSIFLMTRRYFLETNLTYFYSLFNPFLLGNEDSELNESIIKNLTIINLPQVLILAYTAYKGIIAVLSKL